MKTKKFLSVFTFSLLTLIIFCISTHNEADCKKNQTKWQCSPSECNRPDLCEVDVLRGRQVEALLVALVLQQSAREAVGHLHIAAVVLLRVRGGVGQQGGGLGHIARVQKRCVSVELVRLEEMRKEKSKPAIVEYQQRSIIQLGESKAVKLSNRNPSSSKCSSRLNTKFSADTVVEKKAFWTLLGEHLCMYVEVFQNIRLHQRPNHPAEPRSSEQEGTAQHVAKCWRLHWNKLHLDF